MATRTYDRLILTSGQTYTITAGDTIVVINYVAGDWDGAILGSSSPGAPWYLEMPAAGIEVSGLNITDCDASGGGEIDARDGGVDGGGNENIKFVNAPIIIGIDPTSGAAGDTVEFIGSFPDYARTTVIMGGVSAPVTNAAADKITVTAPAHAAGVVDVVLIDSYGQSATEEDGFTYIAPVAAAGQFSMRIGILLGAV